MSFYCLCLQEFVNSVLLVGIRVLQVCIKSRTPLFQKSVLGLFRGAEILVFFLLLTKIVQSFVNLFYYLVFPMYCFAFPSVALIYFAQFSCSCHVIIWYQSVLAFALICVRFKGTLITRVFK